jgi:hypothetical protein
MPNGAMGLRARLTGHRADAAFFTNLPALGLPGCALRAQALLSPPIVCSTTCRKLKSR